MERDNVSKGGCMDRSILCRGQVEMTGECFRDGGSLGLWPRKCLKQEGSMEGVDGSDSHFPRIFNANRGRLQCDPSGKRQTKSHKTTGLGLKGVLGFHRRGGINQNEAHGLHIYVEKYDWSEHEV